jgi:alpha-glucosidase
VGSACLYQGEELGLPESDVPFELLQDPYGITMWPIFKGPRRLSHDRCRGKPPDRTWASAAARGRAVAAGRSETRRARVDTHEARRDSLLHHCRHLLAWRRGHPALTDRLHRCCGRRTKQVLAFERHHDGEHLLCAFNLSAQPAWLDAPALRSRCRARRQRLQRRAASRTVACTSNRGACCSRSLP